MLLSTGLSPLACSDSALLYLPLVMAGHMLTERSSRGCVGSPLSQPSLISRTSYTSTSVTISSKPSIVRLLPLSPPLFRATSPAILIPFLFFIYQLSGASKTCASSRSTTTPSPISPLSLTCEGSPSYPRQAIPFVRSTSRTLIGQSPSPPACAGSLRDG
jgi:hypothetical protein